MDENNDEFCQFPNIAGEPTSHNGQILGGQSQYGMNDGAIKRSLNALSTNPASRNPYNSACMPNGRTLPVTPPPHKSRTYQSRKSALSKAKDEQIMLLMMKTSGMIESQSNSMKTPEKTQKPQPRSFNQRANKMVEAIENSIGTCTNKDWPFNMGKLVF